MALPRRRTKAGNPVDTKQKALLEQQEKLRQKMQQLERFVEEAPRLKKKVEERHREELVFRSTQSGRRVDAPARLGRQFNAITTTMGRTPRSLKRERREARLTFFVLFLVLIGSLLWLAKYLLS